MRAVLTKLALVGLPILRASRLSASDRDEVIRWLSLSSPRFGGRRVLAVVMLVAFLCVAAAAGAWAALPLYRATYSDIRNDGIGSIAELVEDFEESGLWHYVPAILTQLFFTIVGFALLYPIWLRIGAHYSLCRRGMCWRCGHGLGGVPCEPNDIAICPECAATTVALMSWNEIREHHGSDSAKRVFSPNTSLAKVFWTRRRVVALCAVILMLGVGIGLYLSLPYTIAYVDSHMQASAARAARIPASQLTSQFSSGRSRPAHSNGEPRRNSLVRIDNRLTSLIADFNSERGGTTSGQKFSVGLDDLSPISTPANSDLGGPSGLALELLNSLRAAGLVGELDRLPLTDGYLPRTFVPENEQLLSEQTIPLSACRHAFRLNLARMRVAIQTDDFDEFSRALQTARCISEFVSQGPTLLDAMVLWHLDGRLAEHLHFAVVTRRDERWLDLISTFLDGLDHESAADVLERARVYALDHVSAHFADAARVRRGLNDPALQSLSIAEPFGRLGSFSENISAINRHFDVAALRAKQSLWTAQRHEYEATEQRDLFLVQAHAFSSLSLKSSDRLGLRIKTTRVTLDLERFRVVRGRVPTRDEFALLFKDVAYATDPYSGRTFGYAPDVGSTSGYLLWSVGVDGTDNEGKRHPRSAGIANRPAGAGFDVPLPEGIE